MLEQSLTRKLDEVKYVNVSSTFSRPRLRFVIITLTFLALSGCGRQGQSGNPKGTNQQAAPAAEVTVVTIAPKTIPVTFEAVGQTEGSREVEVRARVGGILLQRFYNEREFVKQGTLLFKIDPCRIRLR